MNVALIWSLPASFEESVLTANTQIRMKPASKNVSLPVTGSPASCKSGFTDTKKVRKYLAVSQARTDVIAG